MNDKTLSAVTTLAIVLGGIIIVVMVMRKPTVTAAPMTTAKTNAGTSTFGSILSLVGDLGKAYLGKSASSSSGGSGVQSDGSYVVNYTDSDLVL
jgi:hypothetical protein